MTESSTVQLCKWCGCLVTKPISLGSFQQIKKCLWGTARAPALPRCNLFFFSRLISLRKEWPWGRKAGFCSQLCACLFSVWRSGFASAQQGTKKGSGCKQRCWAVEMPTEPCHRKPCTLLQPANVPVLCGSEGGKNETRLLGHKMFLHRRTVRHFHWENKNIL